jgi:hypothetical protein
MSVLYKEFGLTAKEAAEITADVVEIIRKRLSDEEAIEFLKGRYEGNKLYFAILMVGRLIGMSFALQDPEKAKAIVADFSRLIRILEEKGRDELVKTLEREILEEVYESVERLKSYI